MSQTADPAPRRFGATVRALATIGPARATRVVASRAWSQHDSLGLRADLGRLPSRREARVAVRMEPVPAPSFDGFARALETAAGDDRVELLQRELLREHGLETLFAARSGDGEPIYAQWLVLPDAQEPLHRATGGLYPPLEAGQALVEGAYTFPSFRGLAAMADGMWQLLGHARDAGASVVFTYVSPDNVASLRGCARVGFALDHVRHERRRGGRTSIALAEPDAAATSAWTRGVA